MNHNSRAKWVTALATGSAVGALAGLFWAPYSGRRLRRKIRHSAGHAYDRASATGGKFFKRFEHVAGDVSHFVKRCA